MKNFLIFLFLFFYNIILIAGQSSNGDGIIYNKDFGKDCTSNLECNSACCRGKKCDETGKCKKLVTLVYILDGVVCFIVIVIFLIYMFYRLNKIRESLDNKNSDKELFNEMDNKNIPQQNNNEGGKEIKQN